MSVHYQPGLPRRATSSHSGRLYTVPACHSRSRTGHLMDPARIGRCISSRRGYRLADQQAAHRSAWYSNPVQSSTGCCRYPHRRRTACPPPDGADALRGNCGQQIRYRWVSASGKDPGTPRMNWRVARPFTSCLISFITRRYCRSPTRGKRCSTLLALHISCAPDKPAIVLAATLRGRCAHGR